ncbi:hypothetical protein QLX08_001972 [Tetragonisca angustula]|uniref:Uncharacterized protein n=1 Tax=Tetragonisca angustula TaxID=166442 RepID=A0AAW1AGK0_9HYME
MKKRTCAARSISSGCTKCKCYGCASDSRGNTSDLYFFLELFFRALNYRDYFLFPSASRAAISRLEDRILLPAGETKRVRIQPRYRATNASKVSFSDSRSSCTPKRLTEPLLEISINEHENKC